MRPRRIGVANRRPQFLQGTLTEALRLALARFRKLDNLASDHLTNWIGVVGGRAKGGKRHLESKAHETDSLKIERLAIQEAPDWHRRLTVPRAPVAHGPGRHVF